MALPIRGVAYTLHIALASQAQANTFQADPTIAAGDFQVSKDGAPLANLATLPAVEPASSKLVAIELSAEEMDAEEVTIVGSDQVDAEWKDITIVIPTQAVPGLSSILFNVTPSVVDGGRIESGPLYALVDSADTRTIIVQDDDGNPIDLSGEDLIFVVENTDRELVFSKTSGAGITVGGAGNNEVTVAYTRTDTAVENEGKHEYALRSNTAEELEGKGWGAGPFAIDYVPVIPAP